MILDDIKQAAKRLRKQSPELANEAGSTLTHAQALDVVARLHGFRHYHEARQRLGDPSTEAPLASPVMAAPRASVSAIAKAREILAEVGGLVPVNASVTNVQDLPWPDSGMMVVAGPRGSGKTLLTRELVCLALSRGKPVRIFDTEGSYLGFALAMGGQHFYGSSAEAQAAWNSTAPLVVIDISANEDFGTFKYDHLNGMPKDALFVSEDLAHMGLRTHLFDVLTLQVVTVHDSELSGNPSVSLMAKPGQRHKWLLRMANIPEAVTVQHTLTALRAERFFRRF